MDELTCVFNKLKCKEMNECFRFIHHSKRKNEFRYKQTCLLLLWFVNDCSFLYIILFAIWF